MYTALLGAVLAYGIWAGYRSGVRRILVQLFSLLLAYGLAILLTAIVGDLLQKMTTLGMIHARAMAAIGLLLIGYLCGQQLFRQLFKPPSGKDNDLPTTAERNAGILVGGLIGTLLGLMAVWVAGVLQDARTLQQANTPEPAWQTDPVRTLVDNSVEQIAGQLVDRNAATGQLSQQLMAHPVQTADQLRRFMSHPNFTAWLSHPETASRMNSDDIEQLMLMDDFEALMADDETVNLLAQLSGQPAADHDAMARDLVKTTASLWRRSMRVRTNPEYQQLANDPEIRAILQGGNPAALLTSQKVQRLVELVMETDDSPVSETELQTHLQNLGIVSPPEDPPPAGEVFFAPTPGSTVQTREEAAATTEDESEAPPEAPQQSLWQWKDADGNFHIGPETPPDDALDVRQIQ